MAHFKIVSNKPEHKEINGKAFNFQFGYSLHGGGVMWDVNDPKYPDSAPRSIFSDHLVSLGY